MNPALIRTYLPTVCAVVAWFGLAWTVVEHAQQNASALPGAAALLSQGTALRGSRGQGGRQL